MWGQKDRHSRLRPWHRQHVRWLYQQMPSRVRLCMWTVLQQRRFSSSWQKQQNLLNFAPSRLNRKKLHRAFLLQVFLRRQSPNVCQTYHQGTVLQPTNYRSQTLTLPSFVQVPLVVGNSLSIQACLQQLRHSVQYVHNWTFTIKPVCPFYTVTPASFHPTIDNWTVSLNDNVWITEFHHDSGQFSHVCARWLNWY